MVPGFLDVVSIAIVGRLTGALIGGKLSNLLPGVRVFGGKPLAQSLWLVFIFICLIWGQSLFRVLLRIFQEKIASGIWLDLSGQIFYNITSQDYEFHITKNLSGLSSELFGNLECLLKEIITPVLRAFSSLMSILILTVGILCLGGKTSLGLILVMIASYIFMSSLMTPTLRFASAQKALTRERFTQVFHETFRSIAEIKLAGVEAYFEDKFKDSTQQFKIADSRSQVLPEIPRLLIEPLGITAIFALGVIPRLLTGDKEQIIEILPYLATLSVAGLRLAKPLQDLFNAISRLRGGLPELTRINELLDLKKAIQIQESDYRVTPQGITPVRTIALKNASYKYPGTSNWIIQNIDLVIPTGSRVAIVGPTGSGKTTLAMLFLSLLLPQHGALELDGVPLVGGEIAAWHSLSAQVSQNFQLLDDSVIANIAFGEDEGSINNDRVWEALEAAQLEGLVSELPYGIYTQVGENGINLSGGQRQRVALARAFYCQAKFLVLDEATSALDNQTESDVIQSLEIIGRRCTTLVIAHRLTTIQRCDRIYELCNGKIVAQGNFSELQEISPAFRNLVSLQSSAPQG